MIKVDHDLPARNRATLARWQKEIGRLPTYEARVEEAKKTWTRRNTKQNRTFEVIKGALTEMCSGARRCCYCEDSCADEVEHVKPKSLYPDLAYAWHNYLYACGRCNGQKNAKFAVFPGTDDACRVVTRKRNAPVVPPTPGEPVLLDPRSDNPLDFLELGLRDTFYFLPIAMPQSREFRRADYTIMTLGLNIRDELVAARREAFESYRARLSEYVSGQEQGKTARYLQRQIRALQAMQHPFVWAEMKRSSGRRQDLEVLFKAVPAAFKW